MGLAAPKNKRKLGNDPNNTKWSRNTENFGHRMLRSQGWEPGQYLGPQDATHAIYHTAASASHIKVALKEDNLGLGAKMSRGDECTGLNAFKEMLARLNGKSEVAIEQEKKAREVHAMNVYVERKFGTMRFISGGFLVGDVIRDINKAEPKSSHTTPEPAEARSDKEKKEKKRKAERRGDDDDDDEAPSKEERRRAKKQKKSKKEAESSGGRGETPSDVDSSEEKSANPRSKKDKKRRKEEQASEEQGSEDDESREKRRKREKKERKERRREKREKKLKKKQQREQDSSSESSSEEESTPADSGTSTPVSTVSAVSVRHLARRRFIAQKRMAMKDPQALNQIFMIKSS